MDHAVLWYSQEGSAAKLAAYNDAYMAAYHNQVVTKLLVAANIE